MMAGNWNCAQSVLGVFCEELGRDVGLLAAACDGLLANNQRLQTGEGVSLDDGALVFLVGHELVDLLALDLERTLILVHAVTVEHAHFDDRSGRAGRHLERGVADVRRLLAEDGAEEFLFRRHRDSKNDSGFSFTFTSRHLLSLLSSSSATAEALTAVRCRPHVTKPICIAVYFPSLHKTRRSNSGGQAASAP